jgi:hypothetical protein
MYKYNFDKLSLAIAVTKDELARLLSGEQIAVLKNTRTPFKGGIKCYFYETKTGGGRSQYVAIGELQKATFYNRDGSMRQDCGLSEEDDQKIWTKLRTGNGIIFYFANVVEVEDPDVLTHDIRFQFLIDPPKSVTKMER